MEGSSLTVVGCLDGALTLIHGQMQGFNGHQPGVAWTTSRLTKGNVA